jgi:eukaryotic-like serine/threonine-protein kinase
MSEQPSRNASGEPAKAIPTRIGKYEVMKSLGKGAMGEVLLARDTMLERDVALKVMVAAIADDPELKKRFEREAKAVAKMTHPNVVMVFDLGYHSDGSPFLAMELLKGNDLQKAIRTPPPMPLERKITIILQVLAGLSHAHQAGIVHRDIKPANVFLNDDGTVKIMDFGVARLTTASMTGTGNIVGTADYMSPEQVKGAKVDGRSDVFSVGCMLFELLTGRRPFHSENLMAIFYKITHEQPAFDLVPSGPEYDALLPILKKALAKELGERYQSAYDFAVDLRDYLRTSVTSASGERALEQLVDLEPPPTTPPSFGTSPGEPEPGDETHITAGTMDVGPVAATAATARGTGAPTARTQSRTMPAGAAPTVLQPHPQPGFQPTVVRPTPSAPPRVAPRPMPRPAPQPSGGSPVLYVVLGAMGVALLGLGGYVWLQRQQPPTPPVTQAQQPTPEPAPPTAATPAPTPPPTPEPQPTFKPTQGKGAAAAQRAQAAFGAEDYDRAISQAQEALKADPGNSEAKRILESAVNGQKAEARFQAARTALAQNDLARARSEVDAGRALAPWDSRAQGLSTSIQQAERSAQQQSDQQRKQAVTTQVNALLAQAEQQLTAKKFAAAISLYDEVIKLDPNNQTAATLRASAVGAKAVADAAASVPTSPGAAGRSFTAGSTLASSSQTRAGNLPPGFEETPGVDVRKGTQAAELPGKIYFDVTPKSPKAGEAYTVTINFANEGAAPIQVQSMLVTTVVNGKKSAGPVPPLVKDVAPHDRAQLLVLSGNYWREDTSSWSMEVSVRTTRGETYKNTIDWR